MMLTVLTLNYDIDKSNEEPWGGISSSNSFKNAGE